MSTQRFFIFFLILSTFFEMLPSEAFCQKSNARNPTPDEIKTLRKNAEAFFNAGNFDGALKGYTELIAIEPNYTEINYLLGYCHLITNVKKAKAVGFFESSLKEKNPKKETHYFLGLAYMHAERWDDAIQSYETYKVSSSHSKVIRDFPSVERQIEMCNNAKKIISEHRLNVTFKNLGKTINSIHEDYNPFVSASRTTLVFTSRRKGNMGGLIEELGAYAADVYFSFWKDTAWIKAKNAGASINTDWDEESVGLSADGRTMLVYLDNIDFLSDIATATLKGKTWQKLTSVGSSVNTKHFETGATITLDGSTIYFASDRKDTKVGSELYVAKRNENGEWGQSINLGPVINTLYDESTPFISMDGKTLYFSSKGHNTMGGFDIFRSTLDDSTASWSKPENIGYPINNADDNLYFSMTGNQRYAYVSAVREEGFGDMDIYQVTYNDTIDHPFLALISGTVSLMSGGKAVISKATINDYSNGKPLMTYKPTVVRNEFILAAGPGEYIMSVEGVNFNTYHEILKIANEIPLKDMVLNLNVSSNK